MTEPIAIVGAGLGGLVLARVLHRHGLEARVFEGEAWRGARPQGGMLDLHEETGQLALRKAGLFAHFREIVHLGGQQSRVLDRDGTVLLDEPDDGSGSRPEVSRGGLRQILIESLPEGTIQWGRKLAKASPLAGGRHALTFADGSEARTGLLVGADGAWSRVRPLLSDATPEYVGTTSVETVLREADLRHPASAAAVGGGALFAVAPGKGILAHREPDGLLHAYVQLEKPREWSDGLDAADPAGARARVAEEFDGWAPELRALITASDAAPVVRPLYALPVGHRWDRVPGVTLLGDAAHLMIPSGQGANLAMLDGAELGEALVAHPGDVEAALREYEARIFPRSAAEAAEAWRILDVCLGPRAPGSLIEFFGGAAA